MSDLTGSTVQRAAQLQKRGLRVVPIDHPAHPECIGSTCSKARGEGKDPQCNRDNRRRRGKHPIGGWTTIAASTHSEKGLLYYFADREDGPVNIGIACKASGVLVIDEDILDAFGRFAVDRDQLIDCNYRVRTGKGVHYYFGPPADGTPVGNRSGTLVEWGIDVRGGPGQANHGGFVLAPGSTHASGAVYTELDEWPGKENLRPFPAWLVPEVRAAASAAKGSGPLGMDGAGQPSQERTGASGQRSGGTVFGGHGEEGWTDDVRYGSRAELVAQFERHVLEAKALAGMPSPGSEWRHRFFLAALDGWRLMAIGANRGEVEARLVAAITHVWAAGADAGDEAIVAEAKAKAAASPWELYEQAPPVGASEPGGAATPPSPVSEGFEPAQATSTTVPDEEVRAVFPVKESETLTDGDQPSSPGPADGASDEALTSDAGGMPWDGGEGFTLGDAPVDMAEVYARTFDADVAKRAHQLKVDQAAKARNAAELRVGQPSIEDELIDVTELHKVEPPSMIMAKLLPARQVGFIYGPWGTYKSFVVTNMAIAMALGEPLFGSEEFAVPEPVKSLVVASEGAEGIAQRILTWQDRHGKEIPGGTLSVYPKPLRLNDPDRVAELAALIEDRGYGFVVIDTYHRSAPGVEENSSTDFGVIFEAMAELRDRLGITVLFVDHSGKNGDLRGTSAKATDGDFLLTMTVEGESRKADSQRTLHAEKHKNASVGDGWNVRLVEIPQANSDATLAYLELGDVVKTNEDGSVFESVKRPDTWFQADIDVPPEVAACSRFGNGRQAVLDVFRVMVYGKSIAGLTKAAIVQGVREAVKAGGLKHGRTTIESGLELLINAEIAEPVDPGKPGGPFRLHARYDRLSGA